MSDNSSVPVASGNETFANKDLAGVKYPKHIATEIDGSDSALAAKLGGVTETAPATDTASSGLNGRLQRIAQRVTSLIAATIATSVADGSNVTFGAKADNKSSATDTTAITFMSVAKQVSASIQAAAASLATLVSGVIATGSQASPSAAYLSTIAAGDVAHGAADSGNPQKIGGVAKTANPTAVTDGQRVNAIFDKLGKQIVVGAIRDLKGTQQTQISASTSETTIVTAVASTFLDLYGLILANTGASATKVSIRDDTGGTVRQIIYVPAGETRGFMLPVDSAHPQTAVNKNWTAQCGTSTSALEVTALYVKNI